MPRAGDNFCPRVLAVVESMMLKIENLTKIYDNGFKALDKINIDVPEGQFVAIIGLSGSGKSTLLRCINRLIDPTEGRSSGTTSTSPPPMTKNCARSAAALA
jgi:ABC-type phosphate/phosphonate transport system ATPase subunit